MSLQFDDIYPEIARPYTACFVVLRKSGKIAMVLRSNTGWMEGFYSLPAGKGEWHDTFRQGAAREALEEAGVTINVEDLRFVHLAHRRGSENGKFIDWVDVYFEAEKWQGEPYNAEEDKAERLDWLDINNLPENIVPPQLDALKHIANGELYSEYGWKN